MPFESAAGGTGEYCPSIEYHFLFAGHINWGWSVNAAT
jgi:hypothetical protein